MKSERGFTLLETIVALVIASAALIIIIQTFGGGFRAKASIERKLDAARLSQSLLTEINQHFSIGNAPVEGVFDNAMSWTVEYSPYVASDDAGPKASWARIDVYAADNTASHDILFSMTSLILVDEQ